MIKHILTITILLCLAAIRPAAAELKLTYLSPSDYTMTAAVGTTFNISVALTNPTEDNVWAVVTSSFFYPPVSWAPYDDMAQFYGVTLAPGETKSIVTNGNAGSFNIDPLASPGFSEGGAFSVIVKLYDGDPNNGGTVVSNDMVAVLPLSITVVPNPNKITPTLSVTNTPLTYDGYPREAAVSGNVSGIVSNVKYDGSSMAPAIPGSYAITADFTPFNTSAYASLSGASAGTFVISRLASTISATGTTSFTYNTSPQGPASATVSGSTGAVSYSYSGSGSTSYGPLAAKPAGAGSYRVTATVAADEIYDTATSAPLTFTIGKAAATITLGSLTQAYDGTAKQPSAVTTPAGKVVTYTYNGSPDAPSAVGSYAVIATIDDANYSGSASGTLVIGLAQTISPISLSAPSCAIWETIMASAYATSGLPVSFSSLTPDICSVSETDVTGLRAGTCTIAADQEGNQTYLAASRVTRSLTVSVPMGLTVAISGSGSGSITSVPSSLTCLKSTSGAGTVTCTDFITGTVDLHATPSAVSVFGGWSGACTGSGICSLTMDSAKSVTASFNQSSLLRVGAQDYLTLQAAYNAAANNVIIQMLQNPAIVGGLTANRGLTVKLGGGYDVYSTDLYYEPPGMTTVTAPLKIKAGKIIVDRIVVK